MEVIGAELAYMKTQGPVKDVEELKEDFERTYHANPDSAEAQRRRRLWGTVPLKERQRINRLEKEDRKKAKAQIYNEEVTYG